MNRQANQETPTENLFHYVKQNSNVKSILNPFYIEFNLNKSSLDGILFFLIQN